MDLNERVSKLEGALANLATKDDLGQAKLSLVQWMIAIALTIIVVIIGLGSIVVNAVKATPVSHPQPIVIQVPPPPIPAAPSTPTPLPTVPEKKAPATK